MAHTAVLDPRNPAPAPGQPRPPLLPALTSLRFFAALHVALSHLAPSDPAWGSLGGFIKAGYTGVSFFFVLSGFVLTYSHAREYESGRASNPRFYFARFARIYPIYFIATIFSGMLSPEAFRNKIHLLAYIADFLMVQAWSIRMVNFFNTIAWTLSCEAFFYFVFPFAILRLRPLSIASALRSLTLTWLLAILAPLAYLLIHHGFHYPDWILLEDSPLAFAIRRVPLFAVPQFFAGMVIGWLLLKFPPRRGAATLLAVLGFAMLIPALLLSNRLPASLLHNGLLIPAYAAIILGLSRDNPLTRILSIAPLVLFGEASYVFYLVHMLVNNFMQDHLNIATNLTTAWWKILLLIPLSIALHLTIERPCRKYLLQNWNLRHRPRA